MYVYDYLIDILSKDLLATRGVSLSAHCLKLPTIFDQNLISLSVSGVELFCFQLKCFLSVVFPSFVFP